VATRDEAIRRFATVRRPRGVWRRVVGAVLVVAATACAVRCRTTLGVVMVAAGVAVLRAVALGIVFFFLFIYSGHKEWRTTKRGQGEEAECAQVARHAALGGAKWNGSGAGGADYRFDEADIEEATAASLLTARSAAPCLPDWGNYVAFKIIGDGHCNFRALRYSLFGLEDKNEAWVNVLLGRRTALRGMRTLIKIMSLQERNNTLFHELASQAQDYSGGLEGDVTVPTRFGQRALKVWASGMAGSRNFWGSYFSMQAMTHVMHRPIVYAQKVAGAFTGRSFFPFYDYDLGEVDNIHPDAAFVAYNGSNHYDAYIATIKNAGPHYRAANLDLTNESKALLHVVLLCAPALYKMVTKSASRVSVPAKAVLDYLFLGIGVRLNIALDISSKWTGSSLRARWNAYIQAFFRKGAAPDSVSLPTAVDATSLRGGKLELNRTVDLASNAIVVDCTGLADTEHLPLEAQLTHTTAGSALSHVGFDVARPESPFLSSDLRPEDAISDKEEVGGAWFVLAGKVEENGNCVVHPGYTDVAMQEPKLYGADHTRASLAVYVRRHGETVDRLAFGGLVSAKGCEKTSNGVAALTAVSALPRFASIVRHGDRHTRCSYSDTSPWAKLMVKLQGEMSLVPGWLPCQVDVERRGERAGEESEAIGVNYLADYSNDNDDKPVPTNTTAHEPIVVDDESVPMDVEKDVLPTEITTSTDDPPAAPATAAPPTAALASDATCSSARSCGTVTDAARYLAAYVSGDDGKRDCLAEIEDVTVRQGGTQAEPSSTDQRIAMRDLINKVFTPAGSDATTRMEHQQHVTLTAKYAEPWCADFYEPKMAHGGPITDRGLFGDYFGRILAEHGELSTTIIDSFAHMINSWQRRWLPPHLRVCLMTSEAVGQCLWAGSFPVDGNWRENTQFLSRTKKSGLYLARELGVNVFTYKGITVPVQLPGEPGHWVLVFIDIVNRRVS
ncbi:MAG: OTU domain-containing protein, partial [Bacteroidota bacterium]